MSYMVHQWWLTFEISHPNYLGFCRNKWQQIDSSISGKMKHKADSHIVNLVSLDSHKLWLIAGVNSWCVVIIWAHPYDIFIFIYNEESTFWVIWVINYWYNFWNTGFSLSPPILTFLITPQREWTAVNESLMSPLPFFAFLLLLVGCRGEGCHQIVNHQQIVTLCFFQDNLHRSRSQTIAFRLMSPSWRYS